MAMGFYEAVAQCDSRVGYSLSFLIQYVHIIELHGNCTSIVILYLQ